MMKYFFLVCCTVIYACGRIDRKLISALQLAGTNRPELEKVLENYSKTEADSLKLKAAKFLIANMPGHFAYDSSALKVYRPILHMYDSLYQIKKAFPRFDYSEQLNRQWLQLINRYNLEENVYGKPLMEDIKNVKASYLIDQIDRAFCAWDSAKQLMDINFDTFCEYTLPYRRQIGLCIDDWREHFKKDNIKLDNRITGMPIETFVDSVLLQYSEFRSKGLKHTGTDIVNYPYLKLSDVCISKRVLCETRCWFNSMLFSSLGLPVAIDYVPAWGNRNNNHSWNVIIENKNSLAFEPFWDRERWKYKKIYNNIDEDLLWGKFRLPKVFRYSYSSTTDGPIVDENIQLNDIPSFFRNIKQKDVSNEYFLTSDVKICFDKKSDSMKYLWLCVFNSGNWVPVQWGIIKKGAAYFEKMGRDIVYLPAFYKNGSVIPAANPFLLMANGEILTLKPSEEKTNVKLIRKYPTNIEHRTFANALIGSKIQVSNDKDFLNCETIFEVKKTPDFYMNIIHPILKNRYRYVRFLFPKPNLTGIPRAIDGFPQIEPRRIAELTCFNKIDPGELPVKGKMIFSQGIDSTEAAKCFDNDVLTYTVPKFKSYENLDKCNCWIGLDFQKQQTIDSICFCPQNDKNNIFPNLNYELFYWDDYWISLGRQKAITHLLSYNNVPENALLLLQCLDEGKEERIFLYEGNQQIWK